MLPPDTHLETEIKLRVADVTKLRRRLKQLHARLKLPRTYEFNTLYDTPKKSLYRRGRMIRIRVERPAARRNGHPVSGEAVLTFKGPREAARSRTKESAAKRYKIRQEFEVRVSDTQRMEQILIGLGLYPAFHYEKFRTTYVLPNVKGVQIELDETPLGSFLELEGAPAAIDRAASRLGYSRVDYIVASYGELKQSSARRGPNLLFKLGK